jgi:DNA-binding transcriptional MerR regulator
VSGRSEKDYLRTSELARLAGVSADTLRHYERKGLLARPRRSRNGYREYPTDALDRVRLIRSALSVGFTIDELSRILKERDKGGAPCVSVRELARSKLEEAEMQLADITALRDDLRALIDEWDRRLKESANGQRAGLLESLATSRRAGGRMRSTLVRLPQNRKRRKKEFDE